MVTSPASPVTAPSTLPAPAPVESLSPESHALGLALTFLFVAVFWCSVGAAGGWLLHRALTP